MSRSGRSIARPAIMGNLLLQYDRGPQAVLFVTQTSRRPIALADGW